MAPAFFSKGEWAGFRSRRSGTVASVAVIITGNATSAMLPMMVSPSLGNAP